MIKNDLNFQHRGNLPLRDDGGTRDHLIELIDELLALEAQTHPSAGPCPQKDELSRDATMIAGDLLHDLIGWAIDHQIGLVLNGMPGGAAAPFDNSETDAIRRAGDHAHEATAASYVTLATNIETDRKLLRSLLNASPHSLFPAKLLVEVLPALDAIELGEQPEFFDAKGPQRGRRRPYTKMRSRLDAALHVEFLLGMNKRRADALGDVADAYGRGSHAVEKWINELPDKLGGAEHIDEMKQRARQRGRAAIERSLKGDRRLADRETEALRGDGVKYQELMQKSPT